MVFCFVFMCLPLFLSQKAEMSLKQLSSPDPYQPFLVASYFTLNGFFICLFCFLLQCKATTDNVCDKVLKSKTFFFSLLTSLHFFSLPFSKFFVFCSICFVLHCIVGLHLATLHTQKFDTKLTYPLTWTQSILHWPFSGLTCFPLFADLFYYQFLLCRFSTPNYHKISW